MAELLNVINKAIARGTGSDNGKSSLNITVDPVMTSISAQASKSIYYFPVLCSKNVPAKTAYMVSSNVEGAYGYFMKACFALMPAIKTKDDKIQVEEYLKLFHKNIGIRSDSYRLNLNLLKECQEWKMFPNDPLNEAITTKTYKAEYDDDGNKKSEVTANRKYKDSNDTIGTELGAEVRRYDSNGKLITSVSTQYTEEDHDAEEQKRITLANKSWEVNGDLDKKNALRPTVVEVNCMFMKDSHEISVKIPVGIKTVIHPVEAEELFERLIDKVSGHSILKSLVRWNSGEVNSLTDIMFGTKLMKKNVAGNDDCAKWFDVVDTRKRLNRLSIGMLARQPFLPNMTIHISMDDVNEINRRTGVNLFKNTGKTMKLIRDCFLLAFVITDEATETMYIMYDGHSDYDDIPYSAVKREQDKNSVAVENMLKGMAIGMHQGV